MNPQLERAHLLFQQGRLEHAEKCVRDVIAADPDHGYAHALLTLLLLAQGEAPEARETLKAALRLAPDEAFTFYAESRVLEESIFFIPVPMLGRFMMNEAVGGRAMEAIQAAIRLDPENPEFKAVQARLHGKFCRWDAMLKSADEGLQAAADHPGCLLNRARALNRLGRQSESRATLAETIRLHPEAAFSHAAFGWELLETGEVADARAYFTEALRVSGGLEWPQAGLLECELLANPLYRALSRIENRMTTLPEVRRLMVLFAAGGVWMLLLVGACRLMGAPADLFLVGGAAMISFGAAVVGMAALRVGLVWLKRRTLGGLSGYAVTVRRTGLWLGGAFILGFAYLMLLRIIGEHDRTMQAALMGAIPGLLSMCLLPCFPAGRHRNWAAVLSVVVTALGIWIGLNAGWLLGNVSANGIVAIMAAGVMPSLILYAKAAVREARARKQRKMDTLN